MKPPPYILGSVLLFWGWRAGMFWVGAIAGALLELSHAVRSRWDFTDQEFNRLWDICTIMFLAAAVYLRFSEDVTSAAYKFFQWMPLIFYPMTLGHMFCVRDSVPLKAFSWFLRRKGAEGGNRGIAFGWVYLAICIVTSGATNSRDIWFYIGVAFLIGWALWSERPRRMPDWAWCTLFVVVAGSGFYGQSRMQEVQAYVENKTSEFFVRFGRREFDPTQSRTAMGKIGSLKQSSQIVMKVKAELGQMPERLRQCTYSKLEYTTWRGSERSFDQVPIEPDTTTWTLYPDAPHLSGVRIIQRADRKSALLSVPMRTTQLKELMAGIVETNRYQSVRAKGSPGLLNFVAYASDVSADSEPWEWDKGIPEEEEDAINSVAHELDLNPTVSPERKIAAIMRFFEQNFRYTTYQQARALGLHAATPLSEFLLKTRAGHCEYFASATVLLLRHLGIPARYATGYAVQETEREDDTYVIRERHGHAWALAWVKNKWVEVDSTPPGWELAEEKEFPFYESLKDEWARFTFGFLEWRWLGDWGFFRLAAPWLVVPMMLFLVWRIFGRRMSNVVPLREAQNWPGEDSEYYLLEKRLAKAGLAREPQESPRQWLSRISADAPAVAETLRRILQLHYRYRFDPEGIQPTEREELRTHVQACLTKL